MINAVVMESPHPSRRCCPGYNVGLGFLPVLLGALMSLTFLTTYMIAVHYGHIYPYFPTISDTGSYKPESNVFGLMLAICSFLAFTVLVLRYLQVVNMLESFDGEQTTLNWLNRIGFLFGLAASVGMAIVAAYQGRGSSLRGHFIGAILAFFCGLLYCYFQTIITYGTIDHGRSTCRMFLLRLFISGMDTFFLVFGQIAGHLSGVEWSKNEPIHSEFHWQPGDPGYTLHVLNDVSEWLMAVSLLAFFLTFTSEFNRIKVDFNIRRRITYTRPFYHSSESSGSFSPPSSSAFGHDV